MVSADIRPVGHRVTYVSGAVRARDGVIDSMRGVAILMVIGIHSLPHAGGIAFVTAVDAALRPCVPIFLFVSGYLTAQSGYVPLGRRVRRTLAPYTIAFLAAYAFMAVSNPAMDHRPVVIVARYALAYVFVYYYVFVYFGCTVMLWAAMAVVDRGKERTFRLNVLLVFALLGGLTVGTYIDPLMQRFGVSDALIEEVRLRDLPFWFAFVAAGALTGSFRAGEMLRDLRYPLAGAAIAAYAVYAAVRIAGIGDAADYDSMAFFLYATLFCVAMLGFAFDAEPLAALGSASYFIYLWHIFVIMALRQMPALQQHPLAATMVDYAAAVSICIVLAWAIRRAKSPRVAQWLGV